MTRGSAYLRRIAERSAIGTLAAPRPAFASARFAAEPREAVFDPFEASEPMPPAPVAPVSVPRGREVPVPGAAGKLPISVSERDTREPVAPDVLPSLRPALELRSAPEAAEFAASSVVSEVIGEAAPRVAPRVVEEHLLVEERRAPAAEVTAEVARREPLLPVPERHTPEPRVPPRELIVESDGPARVEREPLAVPPLADTPQDETSGQLAAALARMDRLLRPDRHAAPAEPAATAPADGARVNIGRVRVEVVVERPSKKAPAAGAPRAPSRTASLGSVPSKLRFGLGQV